MSHRLDHAEAAPQGMNALGQVHDYVVHSGLEDFLVDLVRLRVSQINGCTAGADHHSRELWARGIGLTKLLHVALWRDAPERFSDREQAALGWAESVTEAADTGVPDFEYEIARSAFGEKELADLTIAIALSNVEDRLAISFRAGPSQAKVH
jgi:AhpD family alkylhydroperoxidase